MHEFAQATPEVASKSYVAHHWSCCACCRYTLSVRGVGEGQAFATTSPGYTAYSSAGPYRVVRRTVDPGLCVARSLRLLCTEPVHTTGCLHASGPLGTGCLKSFDCCQQF
jgi:hypothetical protein